LFSGTYICFFGNLITHHHFCFRAISYNKQLDTDVSSLRRRLKWIFLITNLLLYLAQIAIIIAFMADEEGDLSEREGKPLYEGSLLL
jgi:hypothetical protein